MKVVIATTYVPFTKGGGTMIIDSLADQLKKRKYEVDIVWIPLWWYWQDVPEQALALRLLDITESNGNKIDKVITVRYPSYAFQHPNKVAWFIHHHRGAYDLYGTYYQDLPNTPEGDKVRQMMFQYDTYYLREHRHIYTNSKIVAQRLKQFNQIDADAVLYPPLPDSENFYAGEYGDYFLYTSRVTSIKRQALAVEAMRYVKSPFRLVIAGKGDTPEQMQMVEEIVERYDLQDRVVFTGWVSDEDKIELTANAYACLYIPFDEDSYGYPTLEAFHSHKPVITCTDSGGTDEVIIHNENGMIVEPTAEALAEAMEQLWSARNRIQQMGEAAYQTLQRHHIEWDHVISHLMRD